MGPERLITYCGLYGGCCARYEGYRAFRQAAEIVAEICDAHGFHHWMPHVASEFSYEEFRKGIEFFRRDDTWFTCQGCCKGGGGGPPGCVRLCCEERGVELCFECADFPCKRVAKDTAMLALAASLVAFWLLVLAMATRDWNVVLFGGRYLWEAAGAIGLLWTLGLFGLPAGRVRWAVTAFLLIGMAALSVVVSEWVL